MAVLGIVAEFNPFHNGHQYLLKQTIDQIQPSAVICVMSGNFTQRGEPAICNKWARAEMALQAGVDLIIELPFCFAARSAYYFARGALLTLHKTGVVSHIAFGSESGRLEPLTSVAQLLASEPEAYRSLLKKYLNQGLSFPVARSHALQIALPQDLQISDILRGSNNILGIEYLHVIYEEKLPLVPITICRQGSDYHSTELGSYASASAIRLAAGKEDPSPLISPTMPLLSWDILQREITRGCSPVLPNALEQSILLRLRSISKADLAKIYEVTEGLENRIKDAARTCTTLDSIRHRIKSKRYSLTRIDRVLLYALLSLSKEQIDSFDRTGPQYLHILGFSSKGRKILQGIKNKSSLDLLLRGKDVARLLNDSSHPGAQMLALDVMATDIYTLLFPNPLQRTAGLDFTTPPIQTILS
ncbi:MAG: nucleotidyltransferase [Syntrophomonadaceae bacterium]